MELEAGPPGGGAAEEAKEEVVAVGDEQGLEGAGHTSGWSQGSERAGGWVGPEEQAMEEEEATEVALPAVEGRDRPFPVKHFRPW